MAPERGLHGSPEIYHMLTMALSIPASVRLIRDYSTSVHSDDNVVDEEEIAWMISKRALVYDIERLTVVWRRGGETNAEWI